MKGVFDHLAIAAVTLEAGVVWVEAALGVPLEPGGEHPRMGTHNRLLSLGPEAYLEVIAVNPDAAAPTWPRWFALDGFSSAPRVQAWIVQVPDMAAALAVAPAGTGVPMALARGDLRWQMAVPQTGVLPFDGVFPALIAWQGAAHPAARLPDRGVRLRSLTLRHPQIAGLQAALDPLVSDARLRFEAGAPAMQALFDTPGGERAL